MARTSPAVICWGRALIACSAFLRRTSSLWTDVSKMTETPCETGHWLRVVFGLPCTAESTDDGGQRICIVFDGRPSRVDKMRFGILFMLRLHVLPIGHADTRLAHDATEVVARFSTPADRISCPPTRESTQRMPRDDDPKVTAAGVLSEVPHQCPIMSPLGFCRSRVPSSRIRGDTQPLQQACLEQRSPHLPNQTTASAGQRPGKPFSARVRRNSFDHVCPEQPSAVDPFGRGLIQPAHSVGMVPTIHNRPSPVRDTRSAVP